MRERRRDQRHHSVCMRARSEGAPNSRRLSKCHKRVTFISCCFQIVFPCTVHGGRNDLHYRVKSLVSQINNSNKTKEKDEEVVCATSFVRFLLENMTLNLSKVLVCAVDLKLGSQQFGAKNKRVFWFTATIFTCSLIQTFFCSHNKQLHPTLA